MLASAAEGFDVARLLLDLLVIITAAKLAAEVAERFGVPAVLGEIGAGILIGPSALGLVELTDARGVSIAVLAEVGVLLLLLQVGMEMDVSELGKVGKESLAVAVTGVALPFTAGFAGAAALGHGGQTGVFIGAALTATSVGITARVLGDLRALATTEARVVLGAAVADDVLGLVILTVVVKVVTGGSIGPGTIAGTLGTALAFLVVAGLVGRYVVPGVFDRVHRVASSGATVVVAGLALTLAFAELADAAKLAFIIGAFMAGLAIGQSRQHDMIANDLGAVGNILIPVFFVQIGLHADRAAMFSGRVLALAAVLTVGGVAAKLAAGWAVRRRNTDRLLIGLGMVPRGEVGLIFASIGLANGVLDDELYGALLVVVLVSTMITPPLLRARLGRAEQPAAAGEAAVAVRPSGGWVEVVGGEIRLRSTPPVSATVVTALETAALLDRATPADSLLDWFGLHRDEDIGWNAADTPALLELLRDHDARTWRFLDVTAVLERALPEVATAMTRWRADIRDLDPLGALRFTTVDRVLADDPTAVDDVVLLAAFAADVCNGAYDEWRCAVDFVRHLGRDDDAEQVAGLVADAHLLRAGTRDPEAFDRTAVVQLATHFASPARVRQTAALALALGELPRWQRAALDERVELLFDVLDHPDDASGDAANLAAARLSAAQRLAPSVATKERLRHAPRTALLDHTPNELVRLAALLEPPPLDGRVRVAVGPGDADAAWTVDVACRDTMGLLAKLTDALTFAGLDIVSASVATWADGSVLDTFVVASDHEPDRAALAGALDAALRRPLRIEPRPDLQVAFDNRLLPWHTSCIVTGPDAPGALHAVSAAFAAAGVVVHSARVGTTSAGVHDRFTLSDRVGRKLGETAMERIRQALSGETPRWRQRVLRRRVPAGR